LFNRRTVVNSRGPVGHTDDRSTQYVYLFIVLFVLLLLLLLLYYLIIETFDNEMIYTSCFFLPTNFFFKFLMRIFYALRWYTNITSDTTHNMYPYIIYRVSLICVHIRWNGDLVGILYTQRHIGFLLYTPIYFLSTDCAAPNIIV